MHHSIPAPLLPFLSLRKLSCVGLAAALWFLPASEGRMQTDRAPLEIAPIHAPFDMPQLQRPVFPDRTFDIRDYGARQRDADNVKVTDAIHRAIEAAHRAGGGKVVIPPGHWLTGPVHLMSNINLHVAEGAVVYFSEDREDYLPVVIQRHEGVEAYNYSPLIYAFELRNVAITGRGIFEGQGKPWRDWRRTQPRAAASRVPLSRRDFGKGSGMEGMRPNFAVFWKCDHVLVEGVTFNDSPMWNVHLVYTSNAIVRDVTVNSLDSANGDGIVVDSSRNVLLEYNILKTGDDAVVLKSGLNEDGLRINIPTENVVVRNFQAIDVRTGSGGIVFGSETSGGIRNVYVHDAHFEGADRGIRFKTERGRGNATENIYIRDVTMKNLNMEAINFNTFYSGPTPTGPSPAFRNIDIRNIAIDGVRSAIVLIGLPELWLENISLTDVTVKNAREGLRITRVKNLALKNVSVESQERAMVVEDAYELTLENVTLKDQTAGPPVLLRGPHTGAVFTRDLPKESVEFESGLTEAVLLRERITRDW
jgi:polygalacturonase